MKSSRKRRITAFVLCMVLVLGSSVPSLLIDSFNADEISSEEALQQDTSETAVSEEAGTTEGTTPATEEVQPEVQEDAAVAEESQEAAAPVQTEEPQEVAAPVQAEMELKHEIKDAEGNVTATITAHIPEATFAIAADTDTVSMEVKAVDDQTVTDTIKGLMEKNLAADKVLGNYFLYNVSFKVNDQVVEPTKAVTITFEQIGFQIGDVKKATTFYYNEANSVVGNEEAEIITITQRNDKVAELEAAGQSTEKMDDEYDLSEIELNEDGTAKKVIEEGRRSTIYGCYISEDKPVEKKDETTTDKKEETTSEDKKTDTTTEEKTEQTTDKVVDENVVKQDAEQTRFDYKSDDVNVKVTLTDANDLPADAELVVTPVELSDKEQSNIEAKAEEDQKLVESVQAYDIKFVKDGEEVEPGATVKVSITKPDVIKSEDVAIYHVDDQTKAAEDMKAEVTTEGTVEFDTTHFSKYVIVNTSTVESINVTIQQYLLNDDETFSELYKEKKQTVAPEGKVSGFTADATSGSNYNYKLEKIVQIGDNGKENQLTVQDDAVTISSLRDVTIRCYYKAEKTTFSNGVTYFDYDLGKSGTESFTRNVQYKIDGQNLKYAGSSKFKNSNGKVVLTLVKNQSYWFDDLNCYITYKGNNQYSYQTKDINSSLPKDGTALWMSQKIGLNGSQLAPALIMSKKINGSDVMLNANKNEAYSNGINYAIIPGLVSGLTGSDYQTLEMGTNAAGKTIVEPGYFSLDAVDGKTIYENYKLNFNRVGDTYTLLNSENTENGKETAATADKNTFFPLDEESYTADNTSEHNCYFGMRYDFQFKLNDYVGDLTYTFTGDDDLWVFMDGQLVLDLGGLHSTFPNAYKSTGSEESNTVDLWDYIKDADGNYDETATHQISILYMERGGYDSNCSMSFVIPNVTPIDPVITTEPKATLTFNKVLAGTNNGLAGAEFTLYSDSTCTNAKAYATSGTDGLVSFTNLRAGTYYMKETQSPTGYDANDKTYRVEVTKSGDTATASLYETGLDQSLEPIYKIENSITITEENILKEKTAHVENWDQRTYSIDLYASHNVTVENPVDVVLALDVSGSMPWFVTAPSGGTTTRDKLKNSDKQEQTLNTNGSSGVNAWHYKYYVARQGEGNATEYKPIGWDGNDWRYIKSHSNGSKMFEDKPDGLVTANEVIYIRGTNDKTKLEALQAAVTAFVKNITGIEDSNVGILTFAGDVINEYALGSVTEDTVNNLFNNVVLYGYTNQTAAMTRALAQYDAVGDANGKYVVLFSDGDFSDKKTSHDEVINAADAIKASDKNITLYTAGIFGDMSANGATLMKDCATNADCTKLASTANELAQSFSSIFGSINAGSLKATITDYIDARFIPIDAEGNPLSAGAKVDGGTLGYDSSRGLWYVTWSDVSISYADTADEGWHGSILVKAKEEFAGGNAVSTNADGSQILLENGGVVNFDSPTVNVKSDLLVNNKEVTIYKGDSVPTSTEALKALFDVTAPQGDIVQSDGSKKRVTYSMDKDGNALDANDFTMEWFTSPDCTSGSKIADITNEKPTETTTYYLKVTYKTGETTSDSSSNTDANIAVGVAKNSDSEKYPDAEYGVYKIKVISGEIQIQKTLKDKSTSTKDQVFTFDVTNTETNNITKVSITVPAGKTSATLSATEQTNLSSLPRGTYTVVENSGNTEFVFDSIAENNDKNNSKYVVSSDGKTMTVTLGKSESDVDTLETTNYTEGRVAAVNVTNAKAYKTEPVNFYINLASTIMDTSGNIKNQPAENFTKSVSGSKAKLGNKLHTDLVVKLPDSHDHTTVKTEPQMGVIGSADNTSALEVDRLIRKLGTVDGQNGNQTAKSGKTYDYPDQTNLNYQIIDENGDSAFPTDTEIFDYVKANWGTDGVNKGKTITVNGETIDPSQLTVDNFDIRWYVFKDAGDDYWHIDGILVSKSGNLNVTKTFKSKEIADEIATNTGDKAFKINVTGEFLQGSEASTTTISKTLAQADSSEVNRDGSVTYTWTYAVFGASYTVSETNYNPDNINWTYKDTTWVYTAADGSISDGTNPDETTVTTQKKATDEKTVATQTFAYTNNYTQRTADLDLKKTGTGFASQLEGAKFELTKVDDNTFTPIQRIVKNGDEDIEFNELKAGLYKLTEKEAPTGYMLLGEDIYFKVQAGAIILTDSEGTKLENQIQDNWKCGADGAHYTITIANKVLYNLPSTGGIGIYWYLIGGTLLMLAAALILYRNKRYGEVLKR